MKSERMYILMDVGNFKVVNWCTEGGDEWGSGGSKEWVGIVIE